MQAVQVPEFALVSDSWSSCTAVQSRSHEEPICLCEDKKQAGRWKKQNDKDELIPVLFLLHCPVTSWSRSMTAWNQRKWVG